MDKKARNIIYDNSNDESDEYKQDLISAIEKIELRHRVEDAFLHLKRWRGIVTRYARNTATFLAAVHIRCITLRAEIL